MATRDKQPHGELVTNKSRGRLVKSEPCGRLMKIKPREDPTSQRTNLGKNRHREERTLWEACEDQSSWETQE